MSRTKVLVAMDANRPSFSDASADPVCAFDFFRPDASLPNTPVFELFGLPFITAMVNRYAIRVAQQNDISLMPNDRIKSIDFFLSVKNDVADGFARSPDFALGNAGGCR